MIAAPLPAVVAVSDAINEPRYPSLKGIMGAKSKPTETLSLAEIGVEPERAGTSGSRTTVLALAPPPVEGRPGQDRGRRLGRRAARRLARREEAPVTHPRLPRASRRRDPEGRPGRARARARSRRRRRGRRRRARGRARSPPPRAPSVRPRSTSSTIPPSRPRCRSRASMRSRPSSPRPAPRTSSSPPPSSRPTSQPGCRRGSTQDSTGTSRTLRIENGQLVGKRPALGDTRRRRRRLDEHAADRARPLGRVRAGRDRRQRDRAGCCRRPCRTSRRLPGWSSRRTSRRAVLRSRTPR